MPNRQKQSGGFLIVEIGVALVALGLLLAGLAISLSGFARYNKYQLAKQHCTAAAQAQLDSVAVRGRPLEKEEVERLWPEVTVSFEERRGEGQWQGLRLLEVEAVRKLGEQKVRVKLQRYAARGSEE
jgi:hypothetical protein